MPRNVRNSWVEIEVDGRASRIATGPRRADGGIAATFLVRERASVAKGITVHVRARGDKVELVVWDDRTGNIVHRLEVER